MTKHRSLWFAVAVIIAALAIGLAVFFELRLSERDTVERLGNIGAVEAAIAGFFALLVLVVYTRETFLLRLSAGQQLEGSIRPVVLLEITTEKVGPDPLAVRSIQLKNVGSGSAFDVRTAPLLATDTRFEIPIIPLIEANTSQTPEVIATGLDGSNRQAGQAFVLSLLEHAICKAKLPPNLSVSIGFRSLSGNSYRVNQKINNFDGQSIRIDFISMDPI